MTSEGEELSIYNQYVKLKKEHPNLLYSDKLGRYYWYVGIDKHEKLIILNTYKSKNKRKWQDMPYGGEQIEMYNAVENDYLGTFVVDGYTRFPNRLSPSGQIYVKLIRGIGGILTFSDKPEYQYMTVILSTV